MSRCDYCLVSWTTYILVVKQKEKKSHLPSTFKIISLEKQEYNEIYFPHELSSTTFALTVIE